MYVSDGVAVNRVTRYVRKMKLAIFTCASSPSSESVWGLLIRINEFLIYLLVGDKCLASRSVRFTEGKELSFPLDISLGRPHR
jgi:hypothetical protein